jgi:hypothetical protein
MVNTSLSGNHSRPKELNSPGFSLAVPELTGLVFWPRLRV